MRRKPSLALVIGLAATLFFVLMSLLSLVYTPYNPEAMDLSARFAAPSASHLLGCDHFGRDMLSRRQVRAQPSSRPSSPSSREVRWAYSSPWRPPSARPSPQPS